MVSTKVKRGSLITWTCSYVRFIFLSESLWLNVMPNFIAVPGLLRNMYLFGKFPNFWKPKIPGNLFFVHDLWTLKHDCIQKMSWFHLKQIDIMRKVNFHRIQISDNFHRIQNYKSYFSRMMCAKKFFVNFDNWFTLKLHR